MRVRSPSEPRSAQEQENDSERRRECEREYSRSTGE
jgi:hypothetical protein